MRRDGCPPGGGCEIAEILLKNSEILRVGSCCWFNKGGAFKKAHVCLFICCFCVAFEIFWVGIVSFFGLENSYL